MPSTIPELCDAIVTEINSANFAPLTVVAERVVVPKRNVKEMGANIAALVVPNSVAFDRLSRALDQKRIVIHVAIQQRLDEDDIDSVDALIDLSQAITLSFRGKKLTGVTDMLWVAGETPTIFSGEHYDEFLVFTAIIALTYLQTQG